MRLHSKHGLQMAVTIVASVLLLALCGMLGSSNHAFQSPLRTGVPGTAPFVSPVSPGFALVPGAQSPAISPPSCVSCEICQFWQKSQKKLHPAVATE